MIKNSLELALEKLLLGKRDDDAREVTFTYSELAEVRALIKNSNKAMHKTKQAMILLNDIKRLIP